jgi:sulfate transporter 4
VWDTLGSNVSRPFTYSVANFSFSGTSVYRNIKQYPDAEEFDGIVVVRVNAPLYFANSQNVRDKIRKYRLAAEDKSGEDIKFLIVDLTPCSHIDVSALHVLQDMVDNYKSRNQQLVFSNPSATVLEQFELSGFMDKVGRNYFFASTHDAVKACLNELDVEANSTHDGQEVESEDNA